MISASGGGVDLEVGETGWTTLTLNVVVLEVEALEERRRDGEDGGAVVMMVMPPRLVPRGRPAVLAVTVRVRPAGGTVPVDGVTVSQGSVGVAVKDWPARAGSRGME